MAFSVPLSVSGQFTSSLCNVYWNSFPMVGCMFIFNAVGEGLGPGPT